MNQIIILLGFVWISLVQAEPHGHGHGHGHGKHASAIGTHGMALLQHNGHLYASHMPLANSIHAHQVIFKIELAQEDKAALLVLTRDNRLMSLMPHPFDLLKLMNGSLNEFITDIYVGHFERGGKNIKAGVLVKVEKLLLVADLSEENNGNFYVLPTSTNTALLVHKISSLPSFDQILELRIDSTPDELPPKNQLVKLSDGKVLVPKQMKKLPQFSAYRDLKELYLEEADFRQPNE